MGYVSSDPTPLESRVAPGRHSHLVRNGLLSTDVPADPLRASWCHVRLLDAAAYPTKSPLFRVSRFSLSRPEDRTRINGDGMGDHVFDGSAVHPRDRDAGLVAQTSQSAVSRISNPLPAIGIVTLLAGSQRYSRQGSLRYERTQFVCY